MDHPALTRTNVERLSAGLLVVGLLVAIATADRLPGFWSTALFAVLLVLDAITISWLTRPCDKRHTPSTSPTHPSRMRSDASMTSRCGAAR